MRRESKARSSKEEGRKDARLRQPRRDDATGRRRAAISRGDGGDREEVVFALEIQRRIRRS